MAAADEYSTTCHVLQLCLALQDRPEMVEKEVQSLKGENLALKLVLEEKKTFASVVKDGEVEVDSWKVVAASATKCTLKRHSAVDLNNRFSTLSDECEEGASNTTSATPSVSVERGSSAVLLTTPHSLLSPLILHSSTLHPLLILLTHPLVSSLTPHQSLSPSIAPIPLNHTSPAPIPLIHTSPAPQSHPRHITSPPVSSSTFIRPQSPHPPLNPIPHPLTPSPAYYSPHLTPSPITHPSPAPSVPSPTNPR
ncbi:hypothetical protein Hamer_G018040 [Homarus americanus]|uniref:Uncharacterized protein n=1 Tax=Homarus americanus TaxID=6706 RepID=A0A8J5K384_HOMAM|nr:hypothetical protein Hamer_G018040 [Homarus americanus]